LLCLLLTSSLQPAPGAAADASTPFTSRRPGEIVVPVQLGAEGPFRFLLDTGSTHSAVTAAVADGLNLRPVARTTMTASGGAVECLVVAMPVVELGPARLDGLTDTQLPPTAGLALGHDIDGILGQDFLAWFSFTIDYQASRIRWHQGDDARVTGGVRLALVPSQDRFVVELPQHRNGRALRLVPDSGADTLVLYGEAGRGLVAEWQPGAVVLDSPTGMRRLPRTAIVEGLKVGKTQLGRQPAVVLPGPPHDAPITDALDGLLPLHLFASVEFNAPARSLVIRPR
jgi:hypothetical protein